MLGHYSWKNRNPGPGFGEVIDIDVDALPTTELPSNVALPNLHIAEDGRILFLRVPNFRIGTGDDGLEEGLLYHSTYYGPE